MTESRGVLEGIMASRRESLAGPEHVSKAKSHDFTTEIAWLRVHAKIAFRNGKLLESARCEDLADKLERLTGMKEAA